MKLQHLVDPLGGFLLLHVFPTSFAVVNALIPGLNVRRDMKCGTDVSVIQISIKGDHIVIAELSLRILNGLGVVLAESGIVFCAAAVHGQIEFIQVVRVKGSGQIHRLVV